MYRPVVVALCLCACGRAGFDGEPPAPFELAVEATGGTLSVLLSFEANQPSRVTFAVFDAPQPDLDVTALRSESAGGVATGAVDLTDGSGTAVVEGLTAGEYRVYVIADREADGRLRELTVTLHERHEVAFFEASSGPDVYYFRYVPDEYYLTPDALPALIFLHGWGEKAITNDGTETDLLLRHGPPKLITAGEELPFIVLAPQCSDADWNCWGWATDLVDEVLTDAQASLRIDPRRIYVTGLSTGGGGVFNYAKDYPDKVAAVIPISSIAVSGLSPMAAVPVWAFHCQTDATQPVTNTINALDQLWAAQATDPAPEAPLFTEYADTCHDAWTRTYSQSAAPYPTTLSYDPAASDLPTDIWQWLLAHELP